ncbi:acid-sensing ion channel 1-like isoform X2 [Oculina patagonica]
MSDMILDCFWKGDECSHQNFTPVLTSMGLCHTFNSGENGQQILKVNHAGAKFGLNLKLNIQQYDYYGEMTSQAGLKVHIHHQQTPPMVEELGFSLSPGTSTLAAIRKEKVQNLKDPYETNCTDTEMEHSSGTTKYTTSACMLSCHSGYLVENCGCKDPRILSEDNIEVCGIRKMATCLSRENENFYTVVGDRCKCAIPCEIISFKPLLSYASFPSDTFLKAMIKRNLKNATDKEIENYITLASNFLELNVYFQDLNAYYLEQQPAYTKESLLGEIGGQLGLCIGASLITLLEFCDIIFRILKIRFGRAG